MSDIAGLANDLRLSIHRLTRKMRQQHPEEELTLTQLSALAIIWREGPLTAGDLAAREQVRPPSITRVVDGLAALGVVERKGSPADGRQVLIEITPLGAARMDENVKARNAWLAQQIEGLEPDDQSVLLRAVSLMDRLAAG